MASNEKTTYKIIFTDGANTGNMLVDAIAGTVGGEWNERGCTDSFGTVVVPNEMAQAIENLLNDDDRVLNYR